MCIHINAHIHIIADTHAYVIWGDAGENLIAVVIFFEETKIVAWQDKEREFHCILLFLPFEIFIM